MRPILIDDLLLTARAAARLPEAERAGRLAAWLDQAHGADRYRKRLGRLHPLWGNGSLSARAMAEPMAAPFGLDPAQIDRLAEVIAAVQRWRRRLAAGGGALQRAAHGLSEGKPL